MTSDTLFAWHKLPLKSYLMAIAVFCNEVKGKSMLALSRDLDVQYKTAFVLAHKLREAMAASTKTLGIGGEGRTAEIDGAYFGQRSDYGTPRVRWFMLMRIPPGTRCWQLRDAANNTPSTAPAPMTQNPISPPASRRTWTPSPYCRTASRPLRAGSGMA